MSEKRFNAAVAAAMTLAVALAALLTAFPHLPADGAAAELGYESKLFSGDHVAQINIEADAADWETMLDNAAAEEYIVCNVEIDGEIFYGVGIRPKGNSSLSQTIASGSDRVSFKLEFDRYVSGQSYHGLDKLALNSCYADATYMKEYLSYAMFASMGTPSSLTAFVNIMVNGEPWGCYLAVECLEESYALRNFGTDYGRLYKPESGMDMGAGGGSGGAGAGTDLVYTGDDTENYDGIFNGAVFKNTSSSDKARVVAALKGLAGGENLEEYIDVDQTLRYFAVNTVLVNLDHYTGSFKHNYYLYEKDGILSMLPWDYNLAFGGFQGGSASDSVNFPIDTPVSGDTLENRPMIGKLLENEEYLERYHAYIDEIVTEWFENGKFADTIDALDAMIGEYVKNDATAFFTYEEYRAGLDALKLFGELRGKSLRGQLDGAIPSTAEGQAKDASALIDCSALNMSDMGSMGGGKDGNGGFQNGMTPGNMNFPEKPGDLAPDGMEPSGEPGNFPNDGSFGGMAGANGSPPELPEQGGELPPGSGVDGAAVTRGAEQTADGETREEPPGMGDSSGGQAGTTDTPGRFFSDRKDGGKMEGSGAFGTGGAFGKEASAETWSVLGVCAAALAAALIFAGRYKRRKYRI